MNFKPVELQMALPRTVDAGSHMQEMNQKPVQEQIMMAKATDKQIQAQLESSQEADPDEQVGDRDPNRSQESEVKEQGSDRDPSAEIDAAHPYKGKHVDISL